MGRSLLRNNHGGDHVGSGFQFDLPISDAGQLGRDTAGQAVADGDPAALDGRGLERMDGHIGLCVCVRRACEMTKAATGLRIGDGLVTPVYRALGDAGSS